MPDDLVGTASACFTMLSSPMYTFGALSSGAILSSPLFDGLLGLAAWRWLFLLQGAPAVLIGLLLVCVLPTTPYRATWLSDEHRHLLLAKIGERRSLSPNGQRVHARRTEPHARDSPGSHGAHLPGGSGPPLVRCQASTTVPSAITSRTEPLAVASTEPLAVASTTAGADPPPLTLCMAIRAALPRLTTWLFALQHFANCSIMYIAMFFQPLLLKELLPSFSDLDISTLTIPALALSAVTGVLSALWSDSAPPGDQRTVRRVTQVWGGAIIGGMLNVLGATLLLLATSMSGSTRRLATIIALAMVLLSHPVMSSGAGAFWALHHAAQPRELRAASLSIVNSIGNLGGFVGPYCLGALKDVLGPHCPSIHNGTATNGTATFTIGAAHHHTAGCVTQWGGALTTINCSCLALSIMLATIACSTLLPHRSGARWG